MIEKCDRCGNEEQGDRVYYCRDCKTYFCDACLGDAVGAFERASSAVAYASFCPECSDGGWIGRVDRIGTEENEKEPPEDQEKQSDESSHSDYSSSSSSSDDAPIGFIRCLWFTFVGALVAGIIFGLGGELLGFHDGPGNVAVGIALVAGIAWAASAARKGRWW